MNKRDYKITRKDEWFKVEVWDEHGNWNSVYEKTIEDASKHVIDWWSDTEERQKSKDLMNKAIMNCIEIDKKSGILKGNRDGLD